MATVQEIIAINSRPGNSEKGGSQTYGITLDASPFQRLAEYTYLDNVQKQKDKTAKDQAIATEMGTTMALDPNSTNKELYEALNKQKEEINYLVKNNLDVFDYNKNPSANTKLKELLGQFSANRAKATAFDVLNNSALTSISKIQNVEDQAAAKRILDIKTKVSLGGGADKFFKTGTQLETGLTEFTKEKFEIPKVGKLEYSTIKIGGNNNESQTIQVSDLNSLYAKSEAAWYGVQSGSFTPEENPQKNPEIDLRNQAAKEQFDIINRGKNKFSQETLNKMNELIKEYVTAKAAWDKNPVGAPPQKTSQMEAIDGINKNIMSANSMLARARALDPTLKTPDYRLITYDDPKGLEGAELVYLESISGQTEGMIKQVVKNDFTGSANTVRGQDVTARTAANALAETKAARIAKGQPPLPPEALEKGNIIYSVNADIKTGNLKGYKIRNGEIQDNQGNLITKGTGEFVIPAGASGAYIQEWYKKYNNISGNKEDQVKVQLDSKDNITAKFDNGKIVGIKSSNGGYITIDEFQKISDANSQLKETKYNSETGVGPATGNIGDLP